jgi:hypothetical protein
LGSPKGLGIDNIELDMVALEFKIGSDKISEFIHSFFIGQKMGCELLVEKGASSSDMVHLSH